MRIRSHPMRRNKNLASVFAYSLVRSLNNNRRIQARQNRTQSDSPLPPGESTIGAIGAITIIGIVFFLVWLFLEVSF